MSMNLRLAMMKSGMSSYRLSAISGVPYMTVNDLINEVTPIANARFSTILALAKALGVNCEDLWDESPYVLPDHPEYFTSSVQHALKSAGDIPFLKETLEKDQIGRMLGQGRLFEARYLLCLIDYLCRIYDLPKAKEYKLLRRERFKEPIFLGNPESEKERQSNLAHAIPEFLQANIIEGEIDNVA